MKHLGRMIQRFVSGAVVPFLLVMGLQAAPVAARQSSPETIGTVEAKALPKQAQETLMLILKGGPFPYERKDGSVFSNREGALPRKPRGYYSEYTVKTPFSRDRGARRIIAGKGTTGDPKTSGEYYYTDDHYQTFSRIKLQ